MDTRTDSTPTTALNSDELLAKALHHVFLAGRSTDWLRMKRHFRVFVAGAGVRITDIDGNTFIDGASGWQYGAVGHGRSEIGEAILAQIENVAIVAPEFGNLPAIELAGKLAELTPGDLERVAFCNSGSESVETALKIARQYHTHRGEPGRYKVIARNGSYHGWTYGSMSVTGERETREDFEPLVPMGRFVPQPYCYRCELGLEYPSCELACAKIISSVIEREGPETVSAVIGEPVSHACMVAVPPPEYWPLVRKICDDHGVLLINDEVITGFGRTGTWFGCSHWDITPDILTFAKGVTSGYIPEAGAIVRSGVAAGFDGAEPFAQISTWGGNAVAAAGALANIAIIEREGLVENSARMGRVLLDGLDELRRYPVVGDVRGLGLCACIELVADQKTKAPFAPELNVIDRLFELMEESGLMAREFTTNILLTPPLCINQSEVEEIVSIIDKVAATITKELGY